jgi:hypothetical protein
MTAFRWEDIRPISQTVGKAKKQIIKQDHGPVESGTKRISKRVPHNRNEENKRFPHIASSPPAFLVAAPQFKLLIPPPTSRTRKE